MDFIIGLAPEVVVPGHGPTCGIEGLTELKTYFEYVTTEARTYFDSGISAREAAIRIDLGPYAEWICPARIYLNIERAFREYRGEALDAPWDQLKLTDGLYAVAKARGLELVF